MLTIKKQAHYAYAIVLAGAWLGTVGCTPPGPKALLQGERLITEGKYSEAVSELEPVQNLLGDKAQYWNHLGLAYHHAGVPNKATLAYQQALKIDRNLAVACFNLGCLYLEEKNPGPAIDILITYVTLRPQVVEGWMKLGEAQLRWGMQQQSASEKNRFLDASRRSFEYAQKLSPTAETVNAIGMVTYFRGRQRDSAVNFYNATQLNPNFPAAHLNLAVINHQVLNNHRDALQEYNKFLALNPSSSISPGVQNIVAALNQELNPPPRVNPVTNAPLVTAAQATNTAPPVMVAEISVPKPLPTIPQTSQVVRVERDVQRSELPFGGKPGLLAPRAKPQVIIQTNPEPVRVTRLPDPAKEAPRVVAEPLNRTNLPANIPTPTETIRVADAKTGVSSSPAMENASEGDKRTRKGGVLQKLNPATWFNGASKNKATNTTVQPIRPLPADTNDAGRLVASKPNITPLPPKAAVPRYAFRTSRIDVGNRQEAQKSFSAAMAAQEKENLTEAIGLYQQSVKTDPSFFEANYNLGLSLIQKGEFKQALGPCETTVMLKPAVGEARYNFALALEKSGYFLDAANQYDSVVKAAPENVSANLRLANLYAQQLGNIAGARSHYQKVLELQPQHAQATNIRFWLANNP